MNAEQEQAVHRLAGAWLEERLPVDDPARVPDEITLRRGEVGGEAEILRQAPAFFDPAGLSARQFFATSADGVSPAYWGRARSGTICTAM